MKQDMGNTKMNMKEGADHGDGGAEDDSANATQGRDVQPELSLIEKREPSQQVEPASGTGKGGNGEILDAALARINDAMLEQRSVLNNCLMRAQATIESQLEVATQKLETTGARAEDDSDAIDAVKELGCVIRVYTDDLHRWREANLRPWRWLVFPPTSSRHPPCSG